jgi:tRNA-dihydrouridine synthase B
VRRPRNAPRLLARFSKHVADCHAQLPISHRQRRPVPVSVKTRIGYDTPVVDDWIPRLLEAEPAAICLHGRTLRQRYNGQADWDAIGRAAELARTTSTLILGNGDVTTRADGETRAATYDLDGVLIGRASFGNPFIFGSDPAPASDGQDRQARLAFRHRLIEIALEHARLYEATFQPHKRYRFFGMRKHLGWYVKDIPGANYLRASLMQVNSVQEVEALLEQQKKRSSSKTISNLQSHIST